MSNRIGIESARGARDDGERGKKNAHLFQLGFMLQLCICVLLTVNHPTINTHIR